jgi:hypothetical protein
MIIHVNSKKDLFNLLRLYKILDYKVTVTQDDWDTYKKDTCIRIDDIHKEITEFSSVRYYEEKTKDTLEFIFPYDIYYEYGITLGKLNDISIELLTALIIQQKAQGNKPDINIFMHDLYADRKAGGFTWCDTVQGYEYWSKLLLFKEFGDFNFIMASRIK